MSTSLTPKHYASSTPRVPRVTPLPLVAIDAAMERHPAGSGLTCHDCPPMDRHAVVRVVNADGETLALCGTHAWSRS